MADIRPNKTIRLAYWSGEETDNEGFLSVLSGPDEVRMGVGQRSFISVEEDKITFSGGTPSVFNIQALSSSFKYAGMIQDLPWPLTMIPSTTYTPLPQQIIVPPLVEQLPTLVAVANVATSFLTPL